MTNKKKTRARNLSKKTGMSHQAAVNVLNAKVAKDPVADQVQPESNFFTQEFPLEPLPKEVLEHKEQWAKFYPDTPFDKDFKFASVPFDEDFFSASLITHRGRKKVATTAVAALREGKGNVILTREAALRVAEILESSHKGEANTSPDVFYNEWWREQVKLAEKEGRPKPLLEERISREEELRRMVSVWQTRDFQLYRRSRPKELLLGVEDKGVLYWFPRTQFNRVAKEFGRWYVHLPQGEAVFEDGLVYPTEPKKGEVLDSDQSVEKDVRWTREAFLAQKEGRPTPLRESRLEDKQSLEAMFEVWTTKCVQKGFFQRSKPEELLCGIEYGSELVWFPLSLLKEIPTLNEWWGNLSTRPEST